MRIIVLHVCTLQVTHWAKEDYGKFYNGDSYIVLNTYKKNPSSEVSMCYTNNC